MSDRIFSALVALVALGFIASATQVQTSFLSDPVGPKLFPIIISIVALVCSLAIFIKPDTDPSWPPLKTFLALGICVVVLIAYALALKPMGFLVPTAICSAVISFQIHANFKTAILSGIGVSVVLFAVFKYALGLSLFAFPRGFLGS